MPESFMLNRLMSTGNALSLRNAGISRRTTSTGSGGKNSVTPDVVLFFDARSLGSSRRVIVVAPSKPENHCRHAMKERPEKSVR